MNSALPIYPEIPEENDVVKKKVSRVIMPNIPPFHTPSPLKSGELSRVSTKVMNDVKNEIAKEDTRQTIEQETKLRSLTKKSHHILFKCRSVFPFDLFPDEISIEPSQINISVKTFFFTSHLLTIPIKNIADVHLQTTPFFASLKFIDRTFVENSFEINFLIIHDAERVRKIVQGLIIASAEDINVDKIDTDTLKEQVEQLGNMHQIE